MASATIRSTTLTVGGNYSLGYKGACLRVVGTCRGKLIARRAVAQTTIQLFAAECLLKLFSKDRCSGVSCLRIRSPERLSTTRGTTRGDFILLGGGKVLPLSGRGLGAVKVVKPGTSDERTLVNGCRKATSECVAVRRNVRSCIKSSMEVLASENYSLFQSQARRLTFAESHVTRTGIITRGDSIIVLYVKLSRALRKRRKSAKGDCMSKSGRSVRLPKMRQRLVRTVTSAKGPMMFYLLTKDSLGLGCTTRGFSTIVVL